MLFDVLETFAPREVLINDINRELINLYSEVKNNLPELVSLLSDLQSEYVSKNTCEQKEMYYQKRERFNHLIATLTEKSDTEKAALFLFLNKTCFNGLYRVNSKGLFNVPFNNAKNPPICDAENLAVCSKLLQNVEIKCGDYSACQDFIDEQTFVYIDPPYRPLSATAAFTSYNENDFTDKHQIELRDFIAEIASKGAKVLASNSDPKNANEADNFFDDLYGDFEVKRIMATRMINSNAKKRGAISELLISNIASVF